MRATTKTGGSSTGGLPFLGDELLGHALQAAGAEGDGFESIEAGGEHDGFAVAKRCSGRTRSRVGCGQGRTG